MSSVYSVVSLPGLYGVWGGVVITLNNLISGVLFWKSDVLRPGMKRAKIVDIPLPLLQTLRGPGAHLAVQANGDQPYTGMINVTSADGKPLQLSFQKRTLCETENSNNSTMCEICTRRR